MGGLFITFEGIEGSGKSTQMGLLEDHLIALGLPCVASKEPGGTSLGGELRSLLLTSHPSGEKWHPIAELLLFYADRAQHVEALVKPALLDGKIVLLDRFEDSTRAYQGAQGISESTLDSLRRVVLNDLRPHLTLLFDADPEKTLARAIARNSGYADFSETRFDCEALSFHQKVREGFLNIALQEPDRICVIKADESQEVVAANVWSAVIKLLVGAGFLEG